MAVGGVYLLIGPEWHSSGADRLGLLFAVLNAAFFALLQLGPLYAALQHRVWAGDVCARSMERTSFPPRGFQREFPDHVAMMRELRGARLARTEGDDYGPVAICGQASPM